MTIPRLPLALALCAPAAAQVPLYDMTDPYAPLDQVLAAVGDLDGDGLPELAVGSPAADGGAVDGGVVRVYGGEDLALLFEAYGTQEFAALGASVDGAGDVDADGFPDLVAGCGQFQGNLARVWSGATGSVLHEFSGGPEDTFGWSVAGIGDYDADGFGDVAVGAIQDAAAVGNGYVTVFSGATGSGITTIAGSCGNLGQALAGLGDVDGDGWPDLGIYRLGTIGCDSGVAVVSQAGGGPAFLAPFTHIGGRDAVASAGDVNGDGLPDVAVGAAGYSWCSPGSGYVPGKLRVFNGSGAELLEVDGEYGCTWLGYAVDGLGDLDGDGRGDVAASSVGLDRVDVFSGLDGSVLMSFDSPSGGSFGSTLAALGDLDGDGFVEFGSSGHDDGAWVVSTCPGTLAPYGKGCAGSGGFVPELSALGCPNPGNTLTLRIREGYGGAPAFLAIGTGAGTLPLGSGCNLLVSPLLTVVPLGTLFDFGPGLGYRDVPIAVPAGAAGLSFRFQAADLDPGAPLGFAVSNGLLVEVL